MNRRNFLKVSAGAAAGTALLLGQGCATDAAQRRTLNRIGIQLYTLRSIMQEDFEGTLENLAEIGYDELEFAGYYDRTPHDIRALLDNLGLSAPATHVSIGQVRSDLDGLLEIANIIGHEYLIVPSLPQADRASIDAYRSVAEFFNQAGERCREAGIQFGYHNHDFEYEPMDGQLPYDVLLEETDPELVTMELDIFWVYRGGQDPLDYFERYPGRFELCHVKDMDDQGTLADVGQGVIDFPAIFARAEQAGLRHYFVEHDSPSDPLQTARNSYNYLSGLRS